MSLMDLFPSFFHISILLRNKHMVVVFENLNEEAEVFFISST
jgi:hypothetical protein